MDTTTDAIAKLITEARKRAHGLQFEVDYQTMRALADTLETVTRERDMLAARDLGNVRDGVELLDLNSSLTADLKAVTKERDALREALESIRDVAKFQPYYGMACAALASRATPQEK